MAYPLAWDPLLCASSETWQLVGASRGGGRGMTNQEQVVVGPTAYWKASLTIPVMTRARILAFNAMMAALDGRAGTVLVPINDIGRAPVRPGVSQKNDARLFLTATAGAMNATALNLTRQIGGPVLPGQHFSVGGRLYRLISAVGGDTSAPATFPIAFRPWLREAVPAGTFLNFQKPVCAMRLASDDTGALELQLARFGTVTLEFVEAF